MQRFCTLAFAFGLILMIFGLTYILPIVTSLVFDDGMTEHFLRGMSLNIGIGGIMAGATMQFRGEIKNRDGYLLVTCFWLLMARRPPCPCYGACRGYPLPTRFSRRGIKMFRTLLLWKQARREMFSILHPRAINPVRIGDTPIANKAIQARQDFSRKLKWGPSDFSSEKLLGDYCLRRPRFALRPCHYATSS